MHYKNGRAAKNGDIVLFLGGYPHPVVDELQDATAGNDTCNGRLKDSGQCPDLSACLHIDDVMQTLAAFVPDTSAA